MVTGSTASSMHGEPRLSHDVDLVVGLKHSDAKNLAATFSGEEYYLDSAAILEAIMSNTMFNLLYPPTGDNVDFWLLKKTSFAAQQFKRRRPQLFDGTPIFVSTPEDAILSKLAWAKKCGGSSKQLHDVAGVLELNQSNLDMDYIHKWIEELNLEEYWSQLPLA